MSQSVQELIGKIRKEGLEASRKQAEEIEAQARKNAEALITEAKEEAQRIVARAVAEREKTERATRASLEQAARSTLISLEQSIDARLTRIIRNDVREALTGERLAELIAILATEYVSSTSGAQDVEVVLSEENCKQLREGLLARLQESLKGGITIRSAHDVGAGFTISFDGGKSGFDFSEEALARHLGGYASDQVADLLRQT
jgi:V/A-type H+/Na+-transporting ATPase subunit E